MLQVVDEPLGVVVERARALIRHGRRTVLGITGAPGAGKSTLAAALACALGPDAVVVGMDGFHLADAELVRLGRRARKGAPDTFDSYGYAALLNRLRSRADPVVYAPLFDRRLEEPIGSAVAVDAAVPLVITEGNYLLLYGDGWSVARRAIDVVWYLDLPAVERVERLAARHVSFGMRADSARERATVGSDGANALLVESTRSRADLVLRLTSNSLS
ncbi:nucleoside/nucleotide kinase family protein [uncultured Jatrophihabitans sp.]|uniref:nucleoside/nucleotide kinase family protein n=1 Tax=uncultured Jatrophihabitans sp. TaxID=1610747 RepID=UPI0035CA77A0